MFENLKATGVSIALRPEDERPIVVTIPTEGDTELEMRIGIDTAIDIASELQRAVIVAQSTLCDGMEGDIPLAAW